MQGFGVHTYRLVDAKHREWYGDGKRVGTAAASQLEMQTRSTRRLDL